MAGILDSWPAGSIVAVCAFGVLLLLILSTIRGYLRLRHIPGPRLACFSEIWLFKATAKGDLYKDLENVLRTYGKQNYHIHSPTSMKKVLMDLRVARTYRSEYDRYG